MFNVIHFEMWVIDLTVFKLFNFYRVFKNKEQLLYLSMLMTLSHQSKDLDVGPPRGFMWALCRCSYKFRRHTHRCLRTSALLTSFLGSVT